jgi:hypothetical protein
MSDRQLVGDLVLQEQHAQRASSAVRQERKPLAITASTSPAPAARWSRRSSRSARPSRRSAARSARRARASAAVDRAWCRIRTGEYHAGDAWDRRQRRTDAHRPGPATNCSTARGTSRASAHQRTARARVRPVSGVCSAGLASTVLPATSAAAIWPTKIASGKFHGLMQTNTPRRRQRNVVRLAGRPGSRPASANRLRGPAPRSSGRNRWLRAPRGGRRAWCDRPRARSAHELVVCRLPIYRPPDPRFAARACDAKCIPARVRRLCAAATAAAASVRV